METPLVTIMMPTKNRSHFISDAITSVLNQSYANWELLILDDSPADETKNIVQLFSEFETRIRYIKISKSLNIAEKRNMLLHCAEGDFIGHLDDDDFLREDALEKVMAAFSKNPQLALVYSDMIMVDENKAFLQESKSVDFDKSMLAFLGFRHFTIYKAAVARQAGGFNEHVSGCEDGDFFMRVAREFECKRVSEFLYFYRSHETNFGHQRPACAGCSRQPLCNYFRIWKESYQQFTERMKRSA